MSYQECRSVGVECIVAPYEADSQLAYLSKEGIVDLVITEDSDLLVFGCEKVRPILVWHLVSFTSITCMTYVRFCSSWMTLVMGS